MKKFWFWCELAVGNSRAHIVTGMLDVVAASESEARVALDERVAFELPRLKLLSAELKFARCESLTEFIKKAA